MLLLSWVRKYALAANFRIQTCWPASVAFQVVLILPEALKPCGNHRALPDGGRRKKRGIDFAIPKHTGIRALMEYGFRESSIELGSPAPFSVVNPEDAVQIIGGRPVIGSERIRRYARRKVREPRPPQRPLTIPISHHKCFFSAPPRLCGEFLTSTFRPPYPAGFQGRALA